MESVLAREFPIPDDCTVEQRRGLEALREQWAKDACGSVQQFLSALPQASSTKTAGKRKTLLFKPPSSAKQKTYKHDLDDLGRELVAAGLADEIERNPEASSRVFRDLLDLRAAQLALHSPDQQKELKKHQAKIALGGAVSAVASGFSTESISKSVGKSRALRQTHDRMATRPEYGAAFDGLAGMMADPRFSRATRRQVASEFFSHMRDGLLTTGDHNRIVLGLYPDDASIGPIPYDEPIPFVPPDTPSNQDRLIRFMSTSYRQSLESPELEKQSQAVSDCLKQVQSGHHSMADFLLGKGFGAMPAVERNRVWAIFRRGVSPEAAQAMVNWIPRHEGQHPEEYVRFCTSSKVWGILDAEQKKQALNELTFNDLAAPDGRKSALIEQFFRSLPVGTAEERNTRLEFARTVLELGPLSRGAWYDGALTAWPTRTPEQKCQMANALLDAIDDIPLGFAAEVFKHFDDRSTTGLPVRCDAADVAKRSKIMHLLKGAPAATAAKHLYGMARRELHSIPAVSLQEDPTVTHEWRSDGDTNHVVNEDWHMVTEGTGQALSLGGMPFDPELHRLVKNLAKSNPEKFEGGLDKNLSEQFLSGLLLPLGYSANELAIMFEGKPAADFFPDFVRSHDDYDRVAWPHLPVMQKQAAGLNLIADYPLAHGPGKEAIREFFGSLIRSDDRFEKKHGIEGCVQLVKHDMAAGEDAASRAELEKTIACLRAGGFADMGAEFLSDGVGDLLDHLSSAQGASGPPPSLWRLLIETTPHLQSGRFAAVLAASLAHEGSQLGTIVPQLEEMLPSLPPAHREMVTTFSDIASQSSSEWRLALDMLRSEGNDASRVSPAGLAGLLKALPSMPPAFVKTASDSIQHWLGDFRHLDADKRRALMAVAKRDDEAPLYLKVISAHADALGSTLPDGTPVNLDTGTSFAPAGTKSPTLLEEIYPWVNSSRSAAVQPALQMLARRHDEAALTKQDRSAIRAVISDALQDLPRPGVSLLLEELCLARHESARAEFDKLLAEDEEQLPRGEPLGRFIATLCLASPQDGADLLGKPEVLALLTGPRDTSGEAAKKALRALWIADAGLGNQAIGGFKDWIKASRPALAPDLSEITAGDGADVQFDPAQFSDSREQALALRRKELEDSDWRSLAVTV